MLAGTALNPEPRAVWTAAYINTLEDNCFAGVEPGGQKDSEGKTTPRSLRHLPHHAKGNGGSGPVDLPHLRAALSRAPQMTGVSDAFKAHCVSHLRAHAKTAGVGESESKQATQGGSTAMPTRMGLERRQMAVTGLDLETRAAGKNGLPHVTGYAAVFNSPAEIRSPFGSFTEVVRPGAFAKTIGRDDVRALFNHDENLVLGRSVPGAERSTLRLEEDRHGLVMDIEPPNTALGKDLVELVGRGDITGASFTFTVDPLGQRWTTDEAGRPAQRELLDVTLYDVSPVTFPAYADTEVDARAVAWARRSLAGATLTDEELLILRRLLPQWEAAAAAQANQAPGGAPTSVQGPPEPDAIFAEYRRRQEALEAELRGERT